MANHIIVDECDGILHIQMNRPEKKNALTREMYSDFTNALRRADSDDTIRAIIISGCDGCFTAGNDLTDFLGEPHVDEQSPVTQFIKLLPMVKKPIVASVNGSAVGVGTTMLLHCDIVVAGDDAVFQMPFVQLGLVPEAGSSLLLPMMLGQARAARLLMLGETINAQAAYEFGIVSRVCETHLTLTASMDIAKHLAALPAGALSATKRLMKSRFQSELMEKIDEENEVFRMLLSKPEAKEALTAFIEKRKADFSDLSVQEDR